MPRHARQKSETRTYHVMLRGNERKSIFNDDEDKIRFIETLLDKKILNEFKLFAFCIMDNHVHLIFKEGKDNISRIMKRIATSYAYYYNNKNSRVGHVFQDRYKSECINDEAYLLSSIRYVHNNPAKAGVCNFQEYKWSSIGMYLDGGKRLPEAKEILEIFSVDEKRAIQLFLEFSHQCGDDPFIDIEEDREYEIDEGNVMVFIESFLIKNNINKDDLKRKEHLDKRRFIVNQLATLSNFSSRKIADVIGLNRETVRKLMLSQEPSPRHAVPSTCDGQTVSRRE